MSIVTRTMCKGTYFAVFLVCLFYHCYCPRCSKVNSGKQGDLRLQTEGNLPENCVENLSFLKEETGEKFCLKKGGGADLLACVGGEDPTEECLCGKENIPSVSTNRIVGGNIVSKNQYPWHAMIFQKGRGIFKNKNQMYGLYVFCSYFLS